MGGRGEDGGVCGGGLRDLTQGREEFGGSELGREKSSLSRKPYEV